ncbi:MMPL family transporter [Patulibacter defluvii]|uniref:MMPL family transporter n=1 Tax=Patulibacter defluvii TaxID=3095358 RepID=UPI002A74AB10|nr:MMPL family transporter [Patulibacter sp. DM4]
MSSTRITSPPGGPSRPPRTETHGLLARVVRRTSRAAAKRPKFTILLWILLVVGLTVAGGMTGTKTIDSSKSGVGESKVADERIADAGLEGRASETILVRSGDAATTAATARAVEARVAKLPEVASVLSPVGRSGGDAAGMSRDGGRAVLLRAELRGDPEDAGEHSKPVTKAVGAVRAEHPGVTIAQTGSGSVNDAIDTMVGDDLQRAELFSVPVTLIILVLAFGALVAASVPLLLGITSVIGAMGASGVVSQIAPSGDSTASLLVLIGLAVGVDYSLFYIRREREERRRGKGPEAALDAAAATAGRAILVSGVTVMVALAGLLITGVPDFTSMALGTILVVAIALLGSLTVLPAILGLLGDRIDKGRIPLIGRRRRPRMVANGRGGVQAAAAREHRVWGAIARTVTRRPAVSLTVAVCLLGALAVPALNMHTAEQGVNSLPPGIPAVEAQKQIERSFPGAPGSSDIVVSGHGLDGARQTAALHQLGERAIRVTEGRGPIEVRIAEDARTAVVSVPMPDVDNDTTKGVVKQLRRDVAPTAAAIGPGTSAKITGDGAGSLDFSERVSESMPLVLAFVLGLAFLLLLASFRSARLAAAVIGLNLLSIAATYGVITAVFQNSWAEDLLNFHSTGTITAWLPLMSFVILFGLSMDYTILVLERIREARANGRSPRDAAAEGVAATASTVTSAAVVMVAVFAIFATLRLLEMKQMGVGLASAILLDATIVRAIALPAAVALLGEKGFPPARARRRRRASDERTWEDRRTVGAPQPIVEQHAR